MSERIRVLIVDDHRMFGEALTMLLRAEHSIEMVAALERAEEALDLCRRDPPDVVLMDLDLPGTDGIEATRLLKQFAPQVQVVALTALQRPEVIARAAEVGACGYVLKTRAPAELVNVIRQAAAGEIVMSPPDLPAVLSKISPEPNRVQIGYPFERLTSREVEILDRIAAGASTAEIAQSLYISRFTVQSHVKSILSKLGVHSKLEAVTFGLKHGIIEISASA